MSAVKARTGIGVCGDAKSMYVAIHTCSVATVRTIVCARRAAVTPEKRQNCTQCTHNWASTMTTRTITAPRRLHDCHRRDAFTCVGAPCGVCSGWPGAPSVAKTCGSQRPPRSVCSETPRQTLERCERNIRSFWASNGSSVRVHHSLIAGVHFFIE